ncbi:MAG: response regulator [Deltaproteobacteria bacterium]|nr:response regulator [Deltaproteobacteria bacterium]
MALILVVDDSSFARKVTMKILQASGHETIEADNAEVCFELLSGQNPEVILLDMLMPGKGGLEILGELKEKNIVIPVIVQTADIQESVKKQCIDAGAACVVNKPPNMGELAKAIEAALGA